MEAPQWRHEINQVLNKGGLQVVFQPIRDLVTDAVVGYEALSRFPEVPGVGYISPDQWFAQAQVLGFDTELELMAVGCAIEAIPKVSPAYVSVNVCGATILWPRFAELVMGSFPDHIVVELTEHDVIVTYGPLMAVLAELRGRNLRVGARSTQVARLAIDDVGAGHSGLATIVKLHPDILKMDRALVEGIDTDTVKGALAAGLVIFSTATGMTLVAEGIETEAEREALIALGVTHGQGYLLGRPAPMDGVGTCEGFI